MILYSEFSLSFINTIRMRYKNQESIQSYCCDTRWSFGETTQALQAVQFTPPYSYFAFDGIFE